MLDSREYLLGPEAVCCVGEFASLSRFPLLWLVSLSFILLTSSLVDSMKPFLTASSAPSIRNFVGFFSTICIVSSRSSTSHSIDRSEFFNSVAVHSCSSGVLKSLLVSDI